MGVPRKYQCLGPVAEQVGDRRTVAEQEYGAGKGRAYLGDRPGGIDEVGIVDPRDLEARTELLYLLAEQLEVEVGTDLAEETVSKLLFQMNLQAQVSAHFEETDREDRRAIHVDVRGDDLSILIGRRSETLNAFQYIASLMVGKQVQQWVQLVVDVEGYRSRRERQLRQMASRMAEQAVKTGRRQVLEPMSANERRIIHLELREHPAVTTESIGEEPHRKVTIIPKDS